MTAWDRLTQSRLPRRRLRGDSAGVYVMCADCRGRRVWRFGCPECAQHHLEYHREAFPGHYISIIPSLEEDTA